MSAISACACDNASCTATDEVGDNHPFVASAGEVATGDVAAVAVVAVVAAVLRAAGEVRGAVEELVPPPPPPLLGASGDVLAPGIFGCV